MWENVLKVKYKAVQYTEIPLDVALLSKCVSLLHTWNFQLCFFLLLKMVNSLRHGHIQRSTCLTEFVICKKEKINTKKHQKCYFVGSIHSKAIILDFFEQQPAACLVFTPTPHFRRRRYNVTITTQCAVTQHCGMWPTCIVTEFCKNNH